MTAEQLQRVMDGAGVLSIDEVAELVGMHRTTLDRNITKDHGLVVVPVTTYRVETVAEYQARLQEAAGSGGRVRRRRAGKQAGFIEDSSTPGAAGPVKNRTPLTASA